MEPSHATLFSQRYLRSVFGDEFRLWLDDHDAEVKQRLGIWAERDWQRETSAEAAFISVFFKSQWGYKASGEGPAEGGYTCFPKFRVVGAGAGGGDGAADAALGWFGRQDVTPIPQVMCEFKDIRSDLDSPQRRKDDTRSPVKQCADYLRHAAAPLFGWEGIEPTWGIVTDMNEFRLYWRTRMPGQYERFAIKTKTGDRTVSLLADGEEAAFQRFLFCRLFHKDMLLSEGGPSPLLRLLREQGVRDREIENAFYAEYRRYRERLIDALRTHNPRFPGTPGKLVRLAQKLLDRCIFVLFCEDMGRSLRFPPNLLRNALTEISQSRYFDSADGAAWDRVKHLFSAMNRGGSFAGEPISHFNGGLFADDPDLDGLHVPTEVFCERGQGASSEALRHHPETLLFFAGTYNFATASDGQAITLYTLGRIFEQSITELEYLEAKADGRPSLTEITKRKRDGVYYTPEWVVERIVEETVGEKLADLRRGAGWDEAAVFTEDEIRRQRKSVRDQLAAIARYEDRLQSLAICDPACGSGAFLIHALDYLLRERRRVARERERLSAGQLYAFDEEAAIRDILARNIYGVDINPASVEIAQLALWLHTARADRTLADLAHNICCGNSLVAPADYARVDPQFSLLPMAQQEQLSPFDWRTAFPEVFARDGFDCIVGNPPYVKLQNYLRVYPETARFLRSGRDENGQPIYASTQTGNTDLFLPFIEHGLSLLNPAGRLGYIAPSLWTINEYGEGLRRLTHAHHCLDRWIDFRSFQVFEEATNYTALQFFSQRPNLAVRLCFAPDGRIEPRWDDIEWQVPYEELADAGPWLFAPASVRRLVRRLWRDCDRLDDPNVTSAIMQGLITSSDRTYHLKRLGAGRYRSVHSQNDDEDIEIEDAIMRPLISGPEAERYAAPITDTYILFPYEMRNRTAALIPPADMARRFPLAWAYLRTHEAHLRAREGNSFDDETWYRFGRNQNLDKQHLPKLIVAQTVQHLEINADPTGAFCLNNVRVNGIITEPDNFWYLLAVLNGRIADFVFRWIGKPKDNGYFEANRQFIAPLPIPRADTAAKIALSAAARDLTRLHTKRRALDVELARRLETCRTETRPEEWLWPTLGTIGEWKARAPTSLRGQARSVWAKEHRKAEIARRIELLQRAIRPGCDLNAAFNRGELTLSADAHDVLAQIFLNDADGIIAAMNWRLVLRQLGERRQDAARLVGALRKLHVPPTGEIARQVLDRENELRELEAEIAQIETDVDQRLETLYALTPEERAIMTASAT